MSQDVRSFVQVGIAFDQPKERELLTVFMQAAALAPMRHEPPRGAAQAPLIGWIEREMTAAQLEDLFHGSLVVEVPREEIDQWDVFYGFQCDGKAYEVSLTRGDSIRLAGDAGSQRSRTIVGAKGADLNAWVPQGTFDLAAALPGEGENIDLMVNVDQSSSANDIMRRLIRSAGIRNDQGVGRGFTFGQAVNRILAGGLVLGPELRGAPSGRYTNDDLARESEFTAERVPVDLYRLKNGDRQAKARYRAVLECFTAITGRSFDVQNIAPVSPNNPEQSSAVARVVVSSGEHEVPLEFSGLGAWEALVISTLISGDPGRTVVLDEPALNLHPTLQRRVIGRLAEMANNQFVVITHSPYLVPTETGLEMKRIVRVEQRNGASEASRLDPHGLTNEDAVVKALAESADARALLFAAGVVLVEGGTELGALPGWWSASLAAKSSGTPDDLNIAIFSVDGDGGFGTFAELLHAFNIPWAILCDGFAFRHTDDGQGRGKQVLRQVGERCQDRELRQAWEGWEGDPASRPAFDVVKSLAKDSGIFTVAEGTDATQECFEAYLRGIDAGLLGEAERASRSKPRRGRYFAEKHPECPREIDDLYASILARFRSFNLDL